MSSPDRLEASSCLFVLPSHFRTIRFTTPMKTLVGTRRPEAGWSWPHRFNTWLATRSWNCSPVILAPQVLGIFTNRFTWS